MTEHNREYKVYYSFMHRNEHPYLADEYRIYRQDGINADYELIDTLDALSIGTGFSVQVTGIDVVHDCGIQYNYKVSAYNARGEIDCINPLFSGIDFPCPTPTRTPSSSITPSISITPSRTITPTVTPSITASITPSKTPPESPSVTPSISVSKTVTPTVTTSITPSNTPPESPSVTPSKTITPTVTPSISNSVTPSNTPPGSPSVTPTVTPSKTITPTVTPSISVSKSPPPSPSLTPTVTPSISASSSPPPSPSLTPTVTPSISASSSPPPSPSVTPSISVSKTVTPSVTPSVTASKSPPASPSVTPSISVSKTVTPSVTPSVTASKSPPASPSVTPSISVSKTVTPSVTPSVTASKSPPASPSVTPSISVSLTPSKSPPPSPSITPTVTPSASPPSQELSNRHLFVIETNDTWGATDGAINVSDSSLVNVTIDGQTSSNGIQWPANATSFTVIGYDLGGTNGQTSIVEGNAPNHAPGGAGETLTSPDFGGFASVSSMTITTAGGGTSSSVPGMRWFGGYATNTTIPASTDTVKIPIKFESTAGDFWGIFDFGMFNCLDDECANRTNASSIPNDANNANIHLRVRIAKDGTQGGTVQNVGSNNARITFSGEWGFD